MGSISRRSRIAAVAGVAALVALPFTPALSVWAASNPQTVIASNSISRGVAGGVAADTKTTCKPDNNINTPNNDKNKCPPPVIPEAPLAALLPLSAGIMVGGTYLVMRLRGRNQASA